MTAPRFDAERFIDDCKRASQETMQATAIVPGSVVALDRDVIHSVANCTEKLM